MTFKGNVRDPQHLDFETKITEFDDESEDKIKIFCSSTRPDLYHFTIVIDTIKCPFSIVDCFASLQASSFDNVVKALEEEIIEKKWQTKKDEALKAKPLAKKLRNVVGALDVAAAVAKAKTSRPRKGPLASGITGIKSQVHSQASIQVQISVQRSSRSNVQKSPTASASPSKKRALGPKADAARGSKKNKLLFKEELSTSLASAMSELPDAAHHGEVIDYNNVNVIFQNFFTECQDIFVFDDPRQKIELDVMRLVNVPDAWTIRVVEERGMEDLKTYLMNMLDRTQKQTLCIMPKLDYKPKDLAEMADCEFYIINGQHNVAASKSMIASNVPEAIRKDFRTWNCFIVWTEDVDKLRNIFVLYNRVNHLTPFKPTWATNILAAHAVWEKYGKPLPKHSAIGMIDVRTSARQPPGNDKQFEVIQQCLSHPL